MAKKFDIEIYDESDNDMDGYEKVSIESILDKPFIVEKASVQDDKNGHTINVAFDMNGDKLFIYTSAKRLVTTIENVLKDNNGVVPMSPIKIVEVDYGNGKTGYKFTNA